MVEACTELHPSDRTNRLCGRPASAWRSRGCHPSPKRHGGFRLGPWAFRFAPSCGNGCTRTKTSVTLCSTYRRFQWSAPIIRSLEAAEPVPSGGISVVYPCTLCPWSLQWKSPELIPSHSLGEVRPVRLTAIHFRCQTRSGPVQGRNALGGNTGSELVPEGLARQDRRSRSRWIGHRPYIALHGVEPLVDVSELRSQSLGSIGTDQRLEPICWWSERATPRSALGRVAVDGPWPNPVLDPSRPGSRFHPFLLNPKTFCPCAALK
jgi:hypothetical protein